MRLERAFVALLVVEAVARHISMRAFFCSHQLERFFQIVRHGLLSLLRSVKTIACPHGSTRVARFFDTSVDKRRRNGAQGADAILPS